MSVKYFLVYKDKEWVLTTVREDMKIVQKDTDVKALMRIVFSRKEVTVCAKN